MSTAAGAVLPQEAAIAPARPRLLFIDNVRTVLITLVVVGHLAITYGGGFGEWYYKESGTASDIFTIIMLLLAAILYASLLGLFCFIAGYFTPRAYDRKGAGPFLLDRVKRLAVPLALYEFVINPVIWYVRDVHKGSFEGSLASYLPVYFVPLKSIADGPVWFLLMLLVFSVVYAGWRLLAATLPAAGTPRRGAAPRAWPPPGQRAVALFAVVVGLLTFVVRIWAPSGRAYEPWHQELAHYPQYVGMFVAGLLAYRGNWLANYPAARARLWLRLMPALLIALVGIIIAAGALSGELDERAAGGLNWLSLAYSMWEAWTGVAVSIIVLAWFRSRFNSQGPVAREMAGSAFAVYVLHPAIVVPLALALSGLSMNLSLKFLVVTPVAVALSYLVAGLLRRLPGLRQVL
jgi:glucans biosynthesis protein C